MRESTAEMLRQLDVDLLRLAEFRRRIGNLPPNELLEVAQVLTTKAHAVSAQCLDLLSPLVTTGLPLASFTGTDAQTASAPALRN